MDQWAADLALAIDLAISRRTGDRSEPGNGDHQPLFVRIAQEIAAAVRRGRLRPGQRLPSTRGLAGSLEVHRNTVVAAYEELATQGWIHREQGRGCFVSHELPEPSPKRFAPAGRRHRPQSAGFPLGPAPRLAPRLPWPPEPGVIAFAGGVPDVRNVPGVEIARAYRRALRRAGTRLLDYGDARGEPALREQLATMLRARRGLYTERDDLLVTRGSQMALSLVAQTLVRPGDRVAVEALGYTSAWDALRIAGAELLPVPVDERGIDVERLAALQAEAPLRAVYVTPHHQYPTTAVLSPERRIALLELARKERFAIIEDDYDHEIHFEGRPILPLASADEAGVVVYVGTLSKVLAPGLRLGYVTAARPLLERLVALRSTIDRQGDLAMENAIAELLGDGLVARHTRRATRLYRERRDTLVAALYRELGDVLTFEVPAGGMALWARVHRQIDVEAWSERAEACGVSFPTARWFALDRRVRPFVRLPYAPLRDAEIAEAIARMRRAL